MGLKDSVVTENTILLEWDSGTRATIFSTLGVGRVVFPNGAPVTIYNRDIEQLIDSIVATVKYTVPEFKERTDEH